MSFYINGEEYPVYVDDYLPVRQNKPCFASSRDGELWVALLEKAWAKLHGTYARTGGGLPSIAAQHLLGVPSISVSHTDIKDRERFWSKLLFADQRNFTIFAASKGSGEV